MTQLAPDTVTPLEARSNAYHRMADMLDHLGETWRDWPDLAACARKAGLSPGHFQRLFSAWAGLSPRQYQAALAHAAAGEALRHGASVLEASFDAGLSAPSRLHDLFIAHEGLSPGEAKAGGPDATLSIGRAPTPFGDGAWLVGPRGLIALGFIDDEGQGRNEAEAFADLTRRYPRADIRRDDATAQAFAKCAFERRAPLPVALYGTAFRRRIWRALLDIPPGATLSYGGLADHVGAPKAARAVGAAVGANPLSWFIPCHRALAQDGRLHNYHWGVQRKRAMLALECVQTGDCTLTDGGPALMIPLAWSRFNDVGWILSDKGESGVDTVFTLAGIYLVLGVLFLGWVIYLVLAWRGVRREAGEIYALKRERGELHSHVGEAPFRKAYIASEGPRASTYWFAAALVCVLVLPPLMAVFTRVWYEVWVLAGRDEVFATSTMVHTFFTFLFCSSVIFGVLWITMRRFYMRLPPDLRRAERKLNQGG